MLPLVIELCDFFRWIRRCCQEDDNERRSSLLTANCGNKNNPNQTSLLASSVAFTHCVSDFVTIGRG